MNLHLHSTLKEKFPFFMKLYNIFFLSLLILVFIFFYFNFYFLFNFYFFNFLAYRNSLTIHVFNSMVPTTLPLTHLKIHTYTTIFLCPPHLFFIVTKNIDWPEFPYVFFFFSLLPSLIEIIFNVTN